MKEEIEIPPFIRQDENSKHLLVGNVRHSLIDNETISGLYLILTRSIGREMTHRFFYDSAKKAAYNLQKNLIELTNAETGDVVERISKIPFYISGYGYGIGDTIEVDPETQSFTFRISHSFIADELREEYLKDPVCSFLAGIFAGITEAWTGREYSCIEVYCSANGYPYCEFELFPGSLTDKFFSEIEKTKGILKKLDEAAESSQKYMKSKIEQRSL
ncbi:MAG: V4R domain-containing protein [Halobacteriota archaeon]|nr:V4R domain-containing protein [Halobacteriota archaeon]